MSSVKKNFIYNSIYQIIAILVPLVTTPYVSRILLPEGIGIYSYSYTIANYFVTIAMLGLNNYGNRTIAVVKHDDKLLSRNFLEIYCMQLFFAVPVLLLYFIYIFLVSNDYMGIVLLPIVVSVIFDVNWLFYGLEEFRLVTIRNIIIKVANTIAIFIFVKEYSDLYLYGFIMSISILSSQIFLWPTVNKKIKFKKIYFNNIKKHIKPNLFLFIPVVAVTIYKMLDKIMLGYMVGKIEVGYFESAEKIIQVPLALIVALGTVMLPKMSYINSKKDITESIRYVKISIVFVLFITSFICFSIMSVSKEFVPLFYGNGFEKCVDLFYILLPSCFFLAVANVIRTQILIPMKKDKFYVISVIIGGLVNLSVNIILIPMYGSLGAALGTLLAEIAVCIYQVNVVRKSFPIFSSIIYSIPFVIIGVSVFCFNLFYIIEGSTSYVLFVKMTLSVILLCIGNFFVYVFLKNKLYKFIN